MESLIGLLFFAGLGYLTYRILKKKLPELRGMLPNSSTPEVISRPVKPPSQPTHDEDPELSHEFRVREIAELERALNLPHTRENGTSNS